jgi:hypothetical protein
LDPGRGILRVSTAVIGDLAPDDPAGRERRVLSDRVFLHNVVASAMMAQNRRLLHDETGIKTIGQITEIGVVSQ